MLKMYQIIFYNEVCHLAKIIGSKFFNILFYYVRHRHCTVEYLRKLSLSQGLIIWFGPLFSLGTVCWSCCTLSRSQSMSGHSTAIKPPSQFLVFLLIWIPGIEGWLWVFFNHLQSSLGTSEKSFLSWLNKYIVCTIPITSIIFGIKLTQSPSYSSAYIEERVTINCMTS